MKELFSKPGEYARLADKERLIFDFGDGMYYDIKGNLVPKEESFAITYDFNVSDDPWEQDWIKNEGIEEKLISESTIDPVDEVVDFFGNYGFKNKAGQFVIEPQYAYAYEFTCGLAAVNLNRTWFKTEEGRRVYENHFGYINSRGETVIPFAYSDARPFNKYGVAVIETIDDVFLIDTSGKTIPGTENLSFSHLYEYDDRFLEFSWKDDDNDYEDEDELPIGLYDTKERKVILDPSACWIIQWSEDEILVSEPTGKYGTGDFRDYFINSRGEKIYPWLNNKGFAIVERPNKSLVAIVSVAKFTELTGNPSRYITANGKKYERVFMYGLYSPKEFFILPMEYEKINEVAENIFVCQKDGIITVIKLDENDY